MFICTEKYLFTQYHSAKYVGDTVNKSALQGYSVIVETYIQILINQYAKFANKKVVEELYEFRKGS